MIRERCYWFKMYLDVENWIKNCERCIFVKMSNFRIRLFMGSLLVIKLFEILVIDFIVFELGTDGRENVFVMIDVFIKFICVVLIRD